MGRKESKTIIWMILILLISLALRAYGLDFPKYHWDENNGFISVFYASYYHLVLPNYYHGSFFYYVILFVWDIYLLLKNIPPTTHNLLAAFFNSSTILPLLARSISVFASTGTVAVTYLTGKKIYNSRIGLIGAFFLAVSFLHVAESHYAIIYPLSAFFVILGTYFCARIIQSGKIRDYIFAGLCVGLATAAAYSAAVIALLLIFSHGYYLHKRGLLTLPQLFANGSIIKAIYLAAIAFLCVTPYALIDPSKYLIDIKWLLANNIASQSWVSSEGQPIWLFYITEHLKNGIGIGLLLLALLGLLYSIVRHTENDVLLILFPIGLYVSLFNGANFARYLIPMLPFLAIFAAQLLEALFSFLERKIPRKWPSIIIVLVIIGVTLNPVANSIRFDYWLTQPDTRQIAVEWIKANIPSGSKVAIEGDGMLGPEIPQSHEDLEELLTPDMVGTLSEVYIKYLLETKQEVGYTLLSVFRLDKQRQSDGSLVNIDDAIYYYEQGIEYLITTSWMQRDSNDGYDPIFQASLDKYYKQIMLFEPSLYFRFDPYAWRIDYQALAQVVPGRPGIGGPRLVIYQRR